MPDRKPGRAVRALVSINVAALGGVTILLAGLGYTYVRHQIEERLQGRMIFRMEALLKAERRGGTQAVIHSLRDLDGRGARSFSYLLSGADGGRIAGVMDARPGREGWSKSSLYDDDDGRSDPILVYTVKFKDGKTLSIFADRDSIPVFDGAMMVFLGFSFALVAGLATGGGMLVERAVRRRLKNIVSTTEGIVSGDLSRRIPLTERCDEFDDVAGTINSMLARLELLFSELGRLTSYVAHDLRAPILELQRGLADLAITTEQGDSDSVENLHDRCNEIIQMFDAILAIGELGVARRQLPPLSFSAIVEGLCEEFAGPIDADGRHLTTSIDASIHIRGDYRLLGQLLVNLLENAMHHTAPGTSITVLLKQEGLSAVLIVSDDGTLMTAERRQNIFDGRSMSAGGSMSRSSLGLRFVRMIVQAHGGELSIMDQQPGLAIRIALPTLIPSESGKKLVLGDS